MISDHAQAILDRRAAQARENREAMPQVSAWADLARQHFGDGVRVTYASENGIERGKRVMGNIVSARDMVLERGEA